MLAKKWDSDPIRTMKRLISTLFIVFVAFGANSQVGFKADALLGASFFQVDGDHFAGYNKLGASFGMAVHAPIKDELGLGFEILYTQKGSKRKVNPEHPNPPIFILQYDYLEVPVVLTRTQNDFRFEVGLSYGVNVKAELDQGGGFVETTINKGETAYLLGVAYQFSEHSSLGVRHQQSLFRVGNNYQNGINIFNRIGLYNRGFVVQYRYSL